MFNFKQFTGIKIKRLIIGRYHGLWSEFNNRFGFYVSM